MKTRTPNSIEAAVNRAKAILGAEFLSEKLNCSVSMVYKLSDAEHANSLTLARAVDIDVATQAENGQTPMLDFYLSKIPLTTKKAAELDNSQMVMKLTKDIGDLAGSFADFSGKKSQGGTVLTANEKANLADALDAVIEKAKSFKQALN